LYFFFPLFPIVLAGISPKVMRSAPFRGLAKRFVDFSAFDFRFRLVAFCAGKNACVLRKLNVTAFGIFIPTSCRGFNVRRAMPWPIRFRLFMAKL
jgi:hypothetical protein